MLYSERLKSVIDCDRRRLEKFVSDGTRMSCVVLGFADRLAPYLRCM